MMWRISEHAGKLMTAHYRWPDDRETILRAQASVSQGRGPVSIAGVTRGLSSQAAFRHRTMALDAKASAGRGGPYRRVFKRVLDIALVVASLPVALPMILLFALGNILTGNAPFYTQPRLGRDGKVFRMWKLRTMVADADRKLADVLSRDAALWMEWETTQKLRNDPRITPLGRYLRMTSMDELPQLLNVLKGDMSLVGPRPMLPAQRALYPGDAYFNLRPGLTGTWQVSERNGSCFAARARYDAEYDADVTFAGDVRLIAATFSAVMRGTGL